MPVEAFIESVLSTLAELDKTRDLDALFDLGHVWKMVNHVAGDSFKNAFSVNELRQRLDTEGR